jgi:hypothetical protein
MTFQNDGQYYDSFEEISESLEQCHLSMLLSISETKVIRGESVHFSEQKSETGFSTENSCRRAESG